MNPLNEGSLISVAPMGKFKASFTIVRESWLILKKDKEIIWFPVLSFIASLILILIFGYILFFTDLRNLNLFNGDNTTIKNIIEYFIYFIYYLLSFSVINYFLTGIYIIVQGRLNGQDLTFRDGIKGANQNFSKIIVWSLISSTVGLILKIISDKSRMVGKIIASLFGAAWNVLTYFSLPSLIIGQKSVIQSFKESAKIINNRWGEVIIIKFGLGLYFIVPIVMGVAISVFIIELNPVLKVIIPIMIILVIYFIILIIIYSALNTIFKVVLYEYAKTGKIAEGFSPEIIKEAIQTKKEETNSFFSTKHRE